MVVGSQDSSSGTAPAWLFELGDLFERRLGHGISRKNLERLGELVTTLSASCGLASPEHYVSFIRSLPMDSPLVQALLHETVNKESYFFRDPPTVSSLRLVVLPRLLEAASRRRVFRVWSAGCSTGEEIYTLAILLDELLGDYESWNIALVGTDIDTRALARARRGEYREWSLRSADADQRRRHFCQSRDSGWYQVRARYRRNVSFAFHNLADPQEPIPWPGSFDLILCRNVSIYFSPRACNALGRKLVSALAPGGSWIAGPSDPVVDVGTEVRVLPGLIEHRVQTDEPEDTDHRGIDPRSVAPVSAPRVAPITPAAPPPSAARAAQPPRAARPTQTASVDPALTAELESARAYADSGNVEMARALVDAIIVRNSLLPDAYLLSAAIYEAIGDEERAASELRRLLYLEPSSVEGQFRMGLVLCRRGDSEGAIRALRNAVALSASESDDDDGHRWLQQAAAHQLAALLREPNHG